MFEHFHHRITTHRPTPRALPARRIFVREGDGQPRPDPLHPHWTHSSDALDRWLDESARCCADAGFDVQWADDLQSFDAALSGEVAARYFIGEA